MWQSDSESPFQQGPSPPRSSTLPPPDQLPHMQLLPSSTEKSYVTLSALSSKVKPRLQFVKDMMWSKKGGNRMVISEGSAWCSKRGSYKKEETCMDHGTRERRRKRTDYPWKAYEIRKDLVWIIRIDNPEHNHPPSAPEAFASNRKFCQADIAVIKRWRSSKNFPNQDPYTSS